MIKKILLLVVLFSAIKVETNGQIYYTKNGSITFFSKTILENIDAKNNQVISIINFQTGAIQFSLLNNAFHFPKAKMEEDFNDNYIESDKYPRSTFKGLISGINNIDLAKDGTYKVTVKGELALHGVTRNINVPATIIIKNEKISANSEFNILVKDYNISVPSIVANKIAENIKITVGCSYEKK